MVSPIIEYPKSRRLQISVPTAQLGNYRFEVYISEARLATIESLLVALVIFKVGYVSIRCI